MEIHYTSVEDPTIRKWESNPFWDSIMKVNDEPKKKKAPTKPTKK